MLLRIFTLSFDFSKERFDTSEFDQFAEGKNLLEVKEHFFTKQDKPFVCLLVKYLPQEEIKKNKSAGEKKDGDSSLDLQGQDMDLFNELRKWRAKVCKDEGVPPYIILNNKQLVQIVMSKPTTKASLDSVDGIGKIKIDKYASSILEIVSKFVKKEENSGEGAKEATTGLQQ